MRLTHISCIVLCLMLVSGCMQQGSGDRKTPPNIQQVKEDADVGVKAEQILCSQQFGNVKVMGYAVLGGDVILKCSCADGGMPVDANPCETCVKPVCKSREVSYTCLKYTGEYRTMFELKSEDEVAGLIEKNSIKVPCPPNKWMNSTCSKTSECSSIDCVFDGELKCVGGECVCLNQKKGSIEVDVKIKPELLRGVLKANRYDEDELDVEGTKYYLKLYGFENKKYPEGTFPYFSISTSFVFGKEHVSPDGFVHLNYTASSKNPSAPLLLYIPGCYRKEIDFSSEQANRVEWVIDSECSGQDHLKSRYIREA